jgi:hypothetical protein
VQPALLLHGVGQVVGGPLQGAQVVLAGQPQRLLLLQHAQRVTEAVARGARGDEGVGLDLQQPERPGDGHRPVAQRHRVAVLVAEHP